MFLIEFKENQFIDAERIIQLNINNNRVTFTIYDAETMVDILVDKLIERPFLNQLQELNQSLTNPVARHHDIKRMNAKYNQR
jgi:hypothetical protein